MIKKIALILIIIVLLMIASPYILYSLTINGEYLENIKYKNRHDTAIKKILTDYFDVGEKCNLLFTKVKEKCIYENGQKIVHDLQGGEDIKFFPSTYFIRLSDQGKSIQKLFLSGEVKSKVITSPSEKEVAKLLKSNNTIGWFFRSVEDYAEGSGVSASYHKIGLNDFPSESEIIIPIYIKSNYSAGIVRLYGD